MISIILVSYNKDEVTQACVESIHQNVSIPYEIIIVDNNSSEESIDILDRLENVKLIKNNNNVGFPAACNIGLEHAKGDIIWFLNNDTIIPTGSLERMVELLLSDESIGMVGPVSNRISGIQQIPVDYENDSEIESFALQNSQKNAGQTLRVIRLVGFSMLLRKSTLDKLGGLEERMGIGTFEDDDICLRLVANGYKLMIAKDAFIHHLGNVSFKAAGGHPAIGDHNQRVVSTKYHMTVPDETVLNQDIIDWVSPRAKRIIHVECGAGAYGLYASTNGIYATGLESNSRKLQLAKNHYQRCELFQPGSDFNYNEKDIDTLIIEKQLDHNHTISVVRSLLGTLICGAQVIVQVPKITVIKENVFSTYYDGWNDEGHYPKRGCFEIQ